VVYEYILELQAENDDIFCLAALFFMIFALRTSGTRRSNLEKPPCHKKNLMRF